MSKVLSIKDLKAILNIVKKTDKKKKRRRNKKRLTNNVRSSSQMFGSSQNIPTNISNLQSENLLLQNKQLENKLINDKDNQLVVSDKQDINKLRDDMNSMRSQGNSILRDVYSKVSNLSNIQSKNINPTNVVRSDTFNDNFDVSTTGGDDTFKDIKTQEGEQPILYDKYANVDEIPMSSPPKKFKKNVASARKRSDRIAVAELKAIKLKDAIKEYQNEMEMFRNVPEEKIMKSNSITEVNTAIKRAKKQINI
jgi:hypothetical protein